MDTHDPLCPWKPPLYAQGGTGPISYYPCYCHIIKKIRSDERERIMNCIEEAKVIAHEMMLSGRSLTGSGFANVLESLITESDSRNG